jgi:TP901 family phage tail tape measure protein
LARFSIEATFKANDQMTRVVGKIESGISKFAAGASAKLASVDKVTSRLAGNLFDLGKKAVVAGVAIGAAAGAAVYNIGKTGADFEQAMANVGAVSLMTRGEVKDLEIAALQLGASTKYSATQVAGGMELMGKAGFTNAQILKGIGPILSAAAAEGAEFEEVAGHVSNMLKGMGLETSEAGRVADVLTLASARTNSSISSLGESMAGVSATARQFKVPLEQAVASVALLQDVGLDASVAGSAVNVMLTNMANPSKEAQAAMASLGISFQDAHGDMLPLTDVFAQFSKASAKAGGNMKQAKFFVDLLGMRGQKAGLNLEKLFAEGKFGALVKELDEAAGSAKKMADLRMQTLTGDLTLLGNAIDTVKISLFDMSTGPIRQVVQQTTAWLQVNKDLIKSEFVAFLENARFGVELFGKGAKEGFSAAKIGIDFFLVPLQKLIGLKSDFDTWPDNVRDLGRAFGFIAGAAGAFLLFAGAVKVARGAVLAYEGAVVAVKAATWLWTAAQGAYTLATNGALAATVLNTTATWAGRAATAASNAVTWIAFAATTRFTVAQVGSKIATWAVTAATWLWNTAVGAWTGVTTLATGALAAYRGGTVLSTAATGGATTATNLLNLSMGAFLTTVLAAAAAIGALYAAYDQFTKLLDVSGGWEGLKAGLGSIAEGGSLFEGIDAYQNKQAKEAALSATLEGSGGAAAGMAQVAPQIASPTEAITSSIQTNNAAAEVTVRPEKGAAAAVTKQPKGSIGVRVAPSGTP